jgi:hypothetical protein
MIDVLSYLPARRKQTASGWISFNAVCCQHNGNTLDRRQRGGIKPSDQGWSYHCFNCGYTASFIIGRNVSFKARKLLGWLGVSQEEIERINLESLKHRNVNGILQDRQRTIDALANVNFPERDLPIGSYVIAEHNSEHWQFLQRRQAPKHYPFMMQDESDREDSRSSVIIPFTYNNSVVGYTQRFLDDRTPKYINAMPSNYVFGTDLQQDNWQIAIVVEGIFDALSIDGLAVMHNTVSDTQAQLIRRLGKEVIVVPDQDAAGMTLVDRAIELGWSVSMPEWPEDCKDVNDAVIRLGRLGTLLTIMQAKETSKIKIEMKRKQLVKRLRT